MSTARPCPGPVPDDDLESLEVDLLLEGIYRHYGYDFRQYARASLKRRLRNVLTGEKLSTMSSLQEKILHDPAVMERLLLALTVNVTAMFRDPSFFNSFRQKVVPLLRTYPFIRIWHAGCSTGQEVYSMAILLQEEGIYDRCRIYATDLNEAVLRIAKDAIYPVQSLQEYTNNYLQAGGSRSFSEYYTAAYDHAILSPTLRRNILFAQHNLATDRSFNEFHVILCRNVMIYFQKPLQERVHHLFYESLVPFGVLGLGDKETLQFTPHEQDYATIEPAQKLYQKRH